MRCGVFWLTACLFIATNGQVLTRDHITVNSAGTPYIDTTENPINLYDTSNNYDEPSGYTSTSKSSDSHSDVIRARITSLSERFNERSKKGESQSHKSTESKSPENISASDANKPSRESSAKIVAEISVNNLSSGNTSGGTKSGASASGSVAQVQLTDSGDERLEQTTHGAVKGYKWKETDIYAFIDIPYGKVETPFEVSAL